MRASNFESSPGLITAQRLALLAELMDTLFATDNEPDHEYQMLAQFLIDTIADWAMVYRFDTHGVAKRMGTAHIDPVKVELLHELTRLKPPTDPTHAVARAVQSGQRIFLETVQLEQMLEYATNDEHLAVLRALEPTCLIVELLRTRGRVVGALTFGTAQSGKPPITADDLTFVETLAHRSALVIEQIRLNEDARRHAQSIGHLLNVSERFSRALTRKQVAEVVTDVLTSLVGAQMCGAFEIDAAAGEFTLLAQANWPEGLAASLERIPLDTPLPIADVLSGEPVFLENAEAWLQHYQVPPPVSTSRGGRAALPLLIHGRVIGAITATFAAPVLFDAAQRETLMAIALQCAQALERARLYEAEHAARLSAEHANFAKSQFLGIMSHELRTPLNAVIGYTELLLMGVHGELNERQRMQVQRISASAWHQLGLIEEILSYARIEAGREEVRVGNTDLRKIIQECMELVRPQAQRNGLELRTSVPDCNASLVSDAGKIRQIVLNLVGNAVKFTRAGTVSVELAASPGAFTIAVRDTGPGIAPDRIELIWQPFTQLDASDTREVGGTGLGLAISRRFAQLLKGDLTVQSQPGQGSTFTLTLPRVE